MNFLDKSPEQMAAEVIAETDQMLLKMAVYPGMEVRHVKTGWDYTVVCVAMIEATMTPAVVYKARGGKAWVRPLSEFCDGRFVER